MSEMDTRFWGDYMSWVNETFTVFLKQQDNVSLFS